MSKIKAVFFDQDGVIIDTERDGHRVSFNMTFKEFGFTDEWDIEYYHELLQVGGGKERMKKHWQTKGFSKPMTEEEIDALVKDMHKRKTALFVELIETGKLPLRPGIHRFMKEAMDAGLKLAICTTSNEQAAKAITEGPLKDIKFDVVLAGGTDRMGVGDGHRGQRSGCRARNGARHARPHRSDHRNAPRRDAQHPAGRPAREAHRPVAAPGRFP